MSQTYTEEHQQTRHVLAHHPFTDHQDAEEFLGSPEETLRLTGRVVDILGSGYGMKTYVMRDVRTGNVLEWSSARRYRITVGDELRLSGVVSAHLHRNGVPVTRLRNCFNPMRVG